MEHLPEWFSLAGGIALTAFGTVAAAWAIVGDLRRARASRHWPGVWGVVTQSQVDACGSGDEMHEKHRLCYRFEVDGTAYSGDRVRAGGNFDVTFPAHPGRTWSTARIRQDFYPLGTRVHVLYDPANPRNCCLEPGGLACAVCEVLASTGLAVLGVWIIHRYA